MIRRKTETSKRKRSVKYTNLKQKTVFLRFRSLLGVKFKTSIQEYNTKYTFSFYYVIVCQFMKIIKDQSSEKEREHLVIETKLQWNLTYLT